jgi:PAS domain S-box-containing protein
VAAGSSITAHSDDVLAAAMEAAAVPIVVVDRSGRPAYFNAAACELTGYTRDELARTTMIQRVAPEDRDAAAAVVERLWRGEVPRGHITVHWLRKDGTRTRIEWRFSLLRDPGGAISHIVAAGLDVTERDALQSAHEAAEERFRLSFDGAPVGMWLTRADEDHRGVILSVNRAMTRLLGYTEEELVGRAMWDVTHPDDAVKERRWVSEWLARGAEGVFPYEKRFLDAAGDTVWAAVHISLISREPGSRVFLSHVVDVTDRKLAEHTALEQSVDPLTGLLTEAAFLRDLRVTLAEDRPLSVLRLQLLPAADVQAVHGHAAAEGLVQRGASGLAALLPEDARLARTGAHEFAAFLKATGQESLELARHALTPPSDEPAPGSPGTVTVSFAAGVAACDPGQDEEADALYTSAGAALEDALRTGSGAALSGRAARGRAAKRLRWERRMREGLDAAGFVLHGQPVARLDTGEVHFTELTVRLHDDDGKLVSPSVFLPVAESSGLIVDIDRWLLHRAMDLLRAHPGRRFAIRISAATLHDRRAGDAAVEILSADRDAAQRLLVEIVGAEAPLGLRSTAHRIREVGSRLLLLNFGLAFGSLHHARSLPISALKIHGSFVRDAERDDRELAVIRAIAEVARVYGVATIAELVETRELAHALRRAGVDYGQGFFFGRPEPVS